VAAYSRPIELVNLAKTSGNVGRDAKEVVQRSMLRHLKRPEAVS